MTVAIGLDVGHATVRVVALVDDRPVTVTSFPAVVGQDGAQVVVGRKALALPPARRKVAGGPAERLAWLMRAAVLAVEAEHGPVLGAVIATDPIDGAVERRALRDAAAIAGIPAARLIATPVAITMALPSAPDGRWLVCDAGATAFTASVIDRSGGALDRLATAMDPDLGGHALDRTIAENLARGLDLTTDGETWPWLLAAATVLKEHLGNSAAAEAALATALADAPAPLQGLRPPRRDELELWISPRVRRLDEVCARALSAAGLMSGELGEVVLAGGGARTAAFSKRLGQIMARPARLPADAGFAAATGAARLARMFVADPAALVIDVVGCGLSLGGTDLLPLVPAGAVLPTRESRVIATRKDNETALEVELWEQIDAAAPARPLAPARPPRRARRRRPRAVQRHRRRRRRAPARRHRAGQRRTLAGDAARRSRARRRHRRGLPRHRGRVAAMSRAAIGLVLRSRLGAGGAAHRPPPPQVLQLNATGEPVDLDTVLVPGHVTVVDFWATWCSGCTVVDERLMLSIAGVDAVVVRKIDIGDGDTPVARQHKVGALPHVRIFDRAGNLRYVLAGNDALTAGEIARELANEP